MKMTKWYFEGTEIRFISSEENLDRHILSNREKLQIGDAKIIIEDEYDDDTTTPSSPCRTCNSSTQKIETVRDLSHSFESEEQETPGLFPMSGDVDFFDPTSTFVENDPDLSLLNGVSDSDDSIRSR